MNAATRSTLLRLIGAQVCVHAGMTGFRMAAPLMALREGHSAVAVGVLLALFALAQVFLALPAGRFAERHGLFKPFALASATATAGGLMAVAWPHLEVLCATALCSGAAVCVAMIALQRHAGHLAGNAAELRQVFSWVAIGPSVRGRANIGRALGTCGGCPWISTVAVADLSARSAVNSAVRTVQTRATSWRRAAGDQDLLLFISRVICCVT